MYSARSVWSSTVSTRTTPSSPSTDDIGVTRRTPSLGASLPRPGVSYSRLLGEPEDLLGCCHPPRRTTSSWESIRHVARGGACSGRQSLLALRLAAYAPRIVNRLIVLHFR